MTWKPTLTQLETIAEMIGARAPTAAMASAVGLSLDKFVMWRQRSLAAVRAEEARLAEAEMVPPKPAVAAVSPRVVADRVFERPEDAATELSGAA
jgi:hypothetical protein